MGVTLDLQEIGRIHHILLLLLGNYVVIRFPLASLLGEAPDAKGTRLLNDLLCVSGACPEITAGLVTHHRALLCVFPCIFSFFSLLSRPWACTSQIKSQPFNSCLRQSFLEDSCEDIIY